ncbi:TPA: hypothetical protein GRI77_24120 [Vibrio parahaemolyticus]|nr:hypothetical protein [Vibrio parahaemolyticus]EGQ9517466.1 hypothetical protein [Vibrio parahaemolyticus]OXD41138.1 hypothetical protein CA157_23870 [Vibrio parahaemolyticus]HAS6803762.1 hypothetical protein [Vibrio parahaemolyticus]HAS6814045.1 hypothetical protein [Vibrio parahaemolyticus]
MLNHVKSVVYGFSLFPWLFSLVFFGKSAFLSAVFRTLILWRWKFRELPQSIFWASARLGRLAQLEIHF